MLRCRECCDAANAAMLHMSQMLQMPHGAVAAICGDTRTAYRALAESAPIVLLGKEARTMSIQEVKEDEVLGLLGKIGSSEAVLMYTPLCGTCKIAERMLEIIAATTISVQLTKLNINYAPRLRDEWRISSVPCLVLLQNGQPMRFEYAMRSVNHLYDLLKELESASTS